MMPKKQHARSSSAPATQYGHDCSNNDKSDGRMQYHCDDSNLVIRSGAWRRSFFRPGPLDTMHLMRLKEKRTGDDDPPSSAGAISNASSAATVVNPIAYSVFSSSKKRAIVAMASMAAFFSPFSANSYFPALAKIEQDLNITTQQVNLSATVFMLFQAISPSFWSVLADRHGRRPIYLATLLVYILASIGTALASNYTFLLLFRMLQAFGASSVIAIGAGTIADIAPPSERGGYLGWYSLGWNMGPLVGPAVGGFLSQYLGWRWIFWTMAIVCGIHWLILGWWLPETLRSLVGNGSGYANPTPMQWWRRRRQRMLQPGAPIGKGDIDETSSIAATMVVPPMDEKKDDREWSVRGILMLPFQPLLYAKERDVLVLVTLYGVQMAACYSITTSLPYLFARVYVLDESLIGASYLANGVGCLIGSVVQGTVLNYNYRRMQQQMTGYFCEDDYPIEHVRLRTLWVHAVLFSILLVAYGWALHFKAHIALVLTILFILGFTSQAIFNAVQTLLVDLFPEKSASVTATNNMFRCFFGAVATVMVLPAIHGVGVAWAFTLISIGTLLSRVTLVLAVSHGPRWRHRRSSMDADAIKA